MSSSRQPSPAFPERPVASGGGDWVGARGGGSAGCGARRGRLDGASYNSSFVLRFPAPWERQGDYETRCLSECQDISWKKNNTKIK